MNFYQILLPSLALTYFLLAFVLRTVLQWRKTGVNPLVFGNSDKAHDYVGKVYKVLVAAIWISIVAYSFVPQMYQYLAPITYLESEYLKLSGGVFMLASLLFTLLAQHHMAQSWRIGIDYTEKTPLVQTGLFSISRNPVFVGIMVFYFGIFLVIPNALSFGLMIALYVTIQIQIRLEEAYLMDIHQETYELYRKKVRRWF